MYRRSSPMSHEATMLLQSESLSFLFTPKWKRRSAKMNEATSTQQAFHNTTSVILCCESTPRSSLNRSVAIAMTRPTVHQPHVADGILLPPRHFLSHRDSSSTRAKRSHTSFRDDRSQPTVCNRVTQTLIPSSTTIYY